MSNTTLIRLNQALKWLASACGTIAAAQIAGQLPPWAARWVPLTSLIGGIAAFIAKTPSQAIAAAVLPGKTAPPAP